MKKTSPLILLVLFASCESFAPLPVEELVPLNGFGSAPLVPNSPAVPIVDPNVQTPPPVEVPPLLRLRTLIGTHVVDSVQADLGIVQDFWFDRHTGEIAYLAIERSRGERVFVPQACLRWSVGEGLGLLNLRASDIEEHLAATRAPDYVALFAEQKPEAVEGRITSLGENEDGFLWVKLRASNNHRHRVLVAPQAYLEESRLGLDVNQLVRFDAVETRDSRGRLWIASTAKRGPQRVRFRDPEGRPLWKAPEPTEPALPWTEPDPELHASAVALAFGRYVDPDLLTVQGNGLVLDAGVGRVLHLVVRLGEEERLLPFLELEAIEADHATLKVRRGRITDAPSLRPGDLSSSGFWTEANAYFGVEEPAAYAGEAVESAGIVEAFEPSP